MKTSRPLMVLLESHMSLLPYVICQSKSPNQPRFKRQGNRLFLFMGGPAKCS